MDMHLDRNFYADVCNSVDTILRSTCVASKKFPVSLVSLFCTFTLTLFKLLLLSRKFEAHICIVLEAKFPDDPQANIFSGYRPEKERRLPKSLV